MGGIYGHVGVAAIACGSLYCLFQASVASGGAALPGLLGFIGGCFAAAVYCTTYVADDPPTYIVLRSPRPIEGMYESRCSEDVTGYDLYPVYSMNVR
jgi:hypothetical protein